MKRSGSVAIFLFFLLTIAGAAGCSRPQLDNSSPPENSGPVLTINDKDRTVQVRVGQTISVTLDSNMTTGYKWNLTGKPDAAVLATVGSEYRGPTSSRAIGAGGTEVWTFRAVGPGSTTVRMGYFRPEEKSPHVANEYGFTVVVSGQ